MRVILLGFAAFLSFGIAAEAGEEANNRLLPVQPPDTSADSVENSSDLLSTLLELHHNLIAQIALLQNMPKMSLQSQSETDHLVQHYTAQKNNIEREISLIKSIQDTKVPAEAPRHIFQSLSPEEKTVSSLLNIFKRPKNPSTNDYNDDVAYSLPYPAYYVPDHGQHFPYPYQGVPPKPNYPHENTLIEDTFPGYSQHNHNEGGVFMTKSQRRPSKKDYQEQPEEQPSLHIPPQFDPAPQVMLKPQVQPPQVEPQRSPYPPQLQVDDDLYRSQPKPNRQSQIRDEDILRIEQQGQYGQKQGLLVYYPDGIITENEDRPSIVDRFGQVIDRFGEVISSLANRQRNNAYGNDRNHLQKRVKYRPRASSDDKITPRKTEEKKPKMRWVAV